MSENNAKVEFLRKFNDAFAKEDIEYIISCLSDDVYWAMVGHPAINGREAVKKSFAMMEGGTINTIDLHNIIIQGNNAAIDGEMKMTKTTGEELHFGFCDVYRFAGGEELKIDKLTAYVIDLQPKAA